MITSVSDDEGAFPLVLGDREGCAAFVSNGLSKREWFAGQALLGLLSQPNIKFDSPTTPKQIREAYADAAVATADALIASISKAKP